MYRLYIILLAFCVTSCDSENAQPCFKTAGDATVREYDVNVFNKITVSGDMQLVLKQGDVQHIVLKSGANLINEVNLSVIDEVLIASYNDGCNLVRDYGDTQLVVTVPRLTLIRNASSYDVVGDGELTFPRLRLESNILDADTAVYYNNSGFDLTIKNEEIDISANGKARFKLRGTTSLLNVEFADKTARLEAEELPAERVEVFHRSSNKVIVNPQSSLSAIITGPGDIISVNRPPDVDVDERYTGKLIFMNN
ncbi:MAG: head GIN domain-containing protein [Leeuwenhoekiella sp.]